MSHHVARGRTVGGGGAGAGAGAGAGSPSALTDGAAGIAHFGSASSTTQGRTSAVASFDAFLADRVYSTYTASTLATVPVITLLDPFIWGKFASYLLNGAKNHVRRE